MSDPNIEVELIQDETGIAIYGNPLAQDAFLKELLALGIPDAENAMEMQKLNQFLGKTSSALEGFSSVLESSGRYLKLTKESAAKLEKYGLVPVKGAGSNIHHAMLGKSGSIKSWLQVEASPVSIVTNPAALSGVAGLLAQEALLSEIRRIANLLEQLDFKIDSIRDDLRTKTISKLMRVSNAIEDAQVKMRHNGGELSSTAWSVIQSEIGVLDEVTSEATLQLSQMGEKVKDLASLKELEARVKTFEAEYTRWLWILATSLQKRNEIAVIELANVARVNPDQLQNHKVALNELVSLRRARAIKSAQEAVTQLRNVSGLALDRVILHAPAAKRTSSAINNVQRKVALFENAFGLKVERLSIESMSRMDAFRDKKQLGKFWEEAKPAITVAGLSVLVTEIIRRKSKK